ncbi:hypothetical protein IEQ34_005916 [Dendrobium chrysotoxum]|uniref:Uncharacterized protein n=1 Tax=Dendrobium chrysotoxum TaxID=161865 RepID=A0AAV7HED1_DENCH|nr:hypothetical protein IEQ34_005916 [Dendrobium chrysotoxum]
MESSGDFRLDFGRMEHGCKHYKRRCKIRAPCCNEIFHCRHCHNESMVQSNRHELCRHDVKRVICLICDSEQPVAKVCANCGVNMGEYFCEVCKFYDDDTEKGQYHCDECGICRVGGRENFFHCKKCGSCYSIELLDKHLCIENSMRHHCPICYEYLFDSLKVTSVLNCGHTIHKECFQEMINHSQYACPICSKSVCDMSSHWQELDEEARTEIQTTSTFSLSLKQLRILLILNFCNFLLHIIL